MNDIALLASLRALLEERSVTRAAQRLGLSQPALSNHLLRLRRTFGDELLVQTSAGMVLTERGKLILAGAGRILADWSELLRLGEQFVPEHSERRFSIALSDYPMAVLLPPLTKRFREAAPRARLEVSLAASPKIGPKLEGDTLDIAIGGDWLSMDSLKRVSLWTDDLVLVHRKDHPRGVGPIALDEICRLEFVSSRVIENRRNTLLDEALADFGVARNIVVQAPTFTAAVGAVRESNLVADMPRRLANQFAPWLDIFEPPIPVTSYNSKMIWHSSKHNDAGHRWFRRLIQHAAAAHISTM